MNKKMTRVITKNVVGVTIGISAKKSDRIIFHQQFYPKDKGKRTQGGHEC